VRAFRAVVLTAVLLLAAFFGYSIWRHLHDSPVRTNALVDQQTLTAQQELKRTKAFLELERRRRLRAEGAAARSQAVADSLHALADTLYDARRDSLQPTVVPNDSAAAQYWEHRYGEAEQEVLLLRAAFDQQKRTAVLYQGLYVNTMRNLADIGNAASGLNNALTAEHDARQCKIAGLISCPSRGASFVAGAVTAVALHLALRR
jgi:hypothetical protein